MAVDLATLAIKISVEDGITKLRELDRELEKTATAAGNLTGKVSQSGVHTVAATRGMGAWSAIQAEATGHVGEHSLAIGRLERNLAMVAERALGVNSTFGLLGTSLLKFGIGSIETVGVLAGIAAIAAAWSKLTEAARAAQKATDDMLASARQANYAAGPGGGPVAQQYGVQLLEYRKLEQRRSTLESFGQSTATIDLQLAGASIELERTWRRLPMGTLPTITTAARSPEEIAAAAKRAGAEAERVAEARNKAAAERQVQVDEAAWHKEQDLRTARQMKLVPESRIPQIPGQQYGTPESGIFSGVAGALSQFGPQAIVTSAVTSGLNFIASGFMDLAKNMLSGGQAAREFALQTKTLKDNFLAAIAAFKHDDFAAALAQNAASADALIKQAWDALGTVMALMKDKGEALKKALADIAAQEAKNAEIIKRQAVYAQEDLGVRLLRATGRGDAADLLAFKEGQQREMQKAIDSNKDALYLNTLRTVQNNELIAFQNGLLATALRNAPTGFYGIAGYAGQYATPRGPGGYPTDSGAPASGGTPYTGKRNPITIILTLDGRVVTRTVVTNLDQSAAATSGAGSARSDALNRYPA